MPGPGASLHIFGRWLSSQCNRYNRPVNLDDTIVAVATPPGRGGIGVVRIAGPRAREIAEPMLRLKHELEPGRAVFRGLIEPETAVTSTEEVRIPTLTAITA